MRDESAGAEDGEGAGGVSVIYRQMGFEDVGWECSGCEGALWCEDGPPTEGTFGYKYCPFCGERIERSEATPDPYVEDDEDEPNA